ncbi:uncharacterized protein LOC136036545 [Artemia franciscana]|uniref:uncharacterized protein LOC136036545 n=1 Tax=Artemia franciscana TaxID=6661 RepID=UPI0032DA8B59
MSRYSSDFNELPFTCVHNSGAASSLDFMLSCPEVKFTGPSHVDISVSASDHFPLINSVEIVLALRPQRKWYTKSDWRKVNQMIYHIVLDDILNKIKTPEKQILLNIYCCEIIHALHCAEDAAVPTRRVKIGSEIPNWSDNSFLQDSCQHSKFWYKIWVECGRPKCGKVNEVRLLTKRQFAKRLRKHRLNIVDDWSQSFKGSPNEAYKFIKRKRCASDGQNIPGSDEESWVKHFSAEFTQPDPNLKAKYEKLLDDSSSSQRFGYVVDISMLRLAIRRLKKTHSRGIDKLCGMHFVYGTEILIIYLQILYQIIFNTGLVPDMFSDGVLTPVPKNIKDLAQCKSYHPITVSPVLCKLMELLVIDEINAVCFSPDTQFGFKRGISREHVHTILANVLIDCFEKGETVHLAGHDIRRAFDMGIHSHLLFSASSRSLNKSIIAVFRNMHKKLNVRIRLASNDISVVPIPVKKGIRQGAITSPPLYNNSITDSQTRVMTSFNFLWIELATAQLC